MKKINDIILKISLGIMLICGLWSTIYEYLIWNKSIVPDWLDNIFMIPGWISIALIIITLIIDKKLK